MTDPIVNSLRLPWDDARVGEPDAGNLHVRFDEGEQLTLLPTRLVNSVPFVTSAVSPDHLTLRLYCAMVTPW